MTPPTILRFIENGIVREIHTQVKQLKKENSHEVLYTGEGQRIMLEDVLSMNGVSWA